MKLRAPEALEDRPAIFESRLSRAQFHQLRCQLAEVGRCVEVLP
jgi:hypothetical protein